MKNDANEETLDSQFAKTRVSQQNKAPLSLLGVVHLISPNLNFSSPIESCDFDELSKELNRWKDALHNDYIRWQVVHK